MKLLLKGKEFLTRKLEELDIADSSDLLHQQIPLKLREPLQVLMKGEIDLDSNDQYETYYRNYPNHHLSHYLLQKYEMALQANSFPQFQPPEGAADVFVPPFNKQLQRKALILKEVVDEYDEGYTKLEEPIICMTVVHFHHKRGTEVEYKYPNNKSVEEIQNLLVHHAMPDSSHNKMEDYNFFNFEASVRGKKRMLFGVSYFKQIKVTQEMKKNNKQITRSYLQKAIAVVSYLPIFGYLKLRLASTTKAFFSDFNNYKLVDMAYKELSMNMIETWPQMDIQELYIGSDLRVIINLFGAQNFYDIWKAILYQKRVVIFAHSSSSASSFILSLLTLFPGLTTFGIYSKSISKYMQSLRQYALPLRTFSSDNFMSMSFHIQDFHLLSKFQKNAKGSFLIGTTNRLLKETNDYGIQMLVNLENCTIEKKKPRVSWESLSKRQRKFIAELDALISTEKSIGYEGSEDSIRNFFHDYLKAQLLGIMKANKSLRKFMVECNQYQKRQDKKVEDKRKDSGEYQVIEEENEHQAGDKGQDNHPVIPDDVIAIPFPSLLLTSSFPYFLQFHNENLGEMIDGATAPCLMIDNYDYYLKSSDNEFVNYNWREKKLCFGKGRPKSFEGKEIKFNGDQNKAKHIYVGLVEANKYSKNGFYLDKNELYEGDYHKGTKEGYGKLTNYLHRYIGDFKNDLYDGTGQLVCGKDIYVGEFREGVKHGCGKNQGELNYDGEWANNKPEGSGVWKTLDRQYIGIFKKGLLDEQSQVTIRYSNGCMFKGFVKNLEPEGKGFYVDDEGIGSHVVYSNGKIEKHLDQQQQDPPQQQDLKEVGPQVGQQKSVQEEVKQHQIVHQSNIGSDEAEQKGDPTLIKDVSQC